MKCLGSAGNSLLNCILKTLFRSSADFRSRGATDIGTPLSSDEAFLFRNHATRDPIARIPRRIGFHIIRLRMNNQRCSTIRE
jgi:hypothetical protein